MCHIITVAVAKEHVEASRAKARSLHLTVERVSNPSIQARLPADYEAFAVTTGYCSCALYDASGWSYTDRSDALRKKYAKKGWSKAKIERAIGQSAASTPGGFRGLHPDVVRLLADAAALGPVGVLVHWHEGTDAGDPTELKGTSRITATGLADAAATLGEDWLLWVEVSNLTSFEARRASQMQPGVTSRSDGALGCGTFFLLCLRARRANHRTWREVESSSGLPREKRKIEDCL